MKKLPILITPEITYHVSQPPSLFVFYLIAFNVLLIILPFKSGFNCFTPQNAVTLHSFLKKQTFLLKKKLLLLFIYYLLIFLFYFLYLLTNSKFKLGTISVKKSVR